MRTLWDTDGASAQGEGDDWEERTDGKIWKDERGRGGPEALVFAEREERRKERERGLSSIRRRGLLGARRRASFDLSRD